MGPEATILLMQRVLSSTKAEDDVDHIPMIVHQNTQVPSRIDHLISGTGSDPVPTLLKMASDLERLGCDILAMPCNTAHYYYDSLSNSVSVPFLNMVELTVKTLTEMRVRSVGVLASPAVKNTRIFDPYCKEYGLQSFFSENDQEVLSIIKDVKRNNMNLSTISRFKKEITYLNDKGCDAILLGCTEFSILSEHLDKKQVFVDSIDCLTREIAFLATS